MYGIVYLINIYYLLAKPKILFLVPVAGDCRGTAFGNIIELREGDFESQLVNDQCQVYSCEVRGNSYR